jgi:biopolymer transport protein ExbB
LLIRPHIWESITRDDSAVSSRESKPPVHAFQGVSTQESTGLGAVAGGISEALVTTAIGLFVAVPAVWAFNYFTNRIDAFDVEMGNSSSELLDYFLKRVQRGATAAK